MNSVLLHVTQGRHTQCCRPWRLVYSNNVQCSLHLGQIKIRSRCHKWTGLDFIGSCTKTTSSLQHGRFKMYLGVIFMFTLAQKNHTCGQSSFGPILCEQAFVLSNMYRTIPGNEPWFVSSRPNSSCVDAYKMSTLTGNKVSGH